MPIEFIRTNQGLEISGVVVVSIIFLLLYIAFNIGNIWIKEYLVFTSMWLIYVASNLLVIATETTRTEALSVWNISLAYTMYGLLGIMTINLISYMLQHFKFGGFGKEK